MKNTVKKILALVFAVVMVCSLAVPALAADEEKFDVYVTVVGKDSVLLKKTTISLAEKNMNVEKALKDTKVGTAVTVNTTSGAVTHLGGTKVTAEAITEEFGTGTVIVAVNGKAVSEDLATVALEEGDSIVVYWADSKLGTKLAQVDDSRLDEGIVSLYYYDAEGNRQPLKGAKITLAMRKDGTDIVRDMLTSVANETEAKWDDNQYYFTTDEKGQIWIAPEYLDDESKTFYITYAKNNDAGVAVALDKYATNIIKANDDLKKDDGYSADEIAYAKKYNTKNVIDIEVIGYEISYDQTLYATADATGDMTMVYVLVAAAAVVTLAAVVVMKKKAVKAN